MESFRIRGGLPLLGDIETRGSKNTILPAIAAALLTEEPVILENVPGISDVAVMVDIIKKLGATVLWEKSQHRLTIEAKELKNADIDENLARKFRGSVLFAGALLGRFRKVTFPYPGGDVIGARPLTTHLAALESLGVRIQDNGRVALDGANLAGGVVLMEEPSVTATENTILAAVLAPGKTEIRLAACEPHVQEIVRMLQKMGARVQWKNFGSLEIEGVSILRGVRYRINPDELEISSFAALAAATKSEITIRGIAAEYLDAVFLQLNKMGVAFKLYDDVLAILKPKKQYQGFRVQSGLYPKLVTDHLPPFAALATQANGPSLIHEWMYEGRLRYVEELQKMGADAKILDPHRALINGPTPLHGSRIASVDIRTGMTLVIAALIAEGETVISGVDHIDRGYEKLDERLCALGASIERVA
ncbi:MAG: UDP-N-acetylglucosamine 1-carboxyvinyltransferase [Candidatus Sungbacteria bacterium RIFCSPHIGHO2_02_FULL_49_12]|uniref:UDP-N-acetylglucosamine 1-carboxyvinyltransferase n=2 Tax=Parcubacteria group TaxID=1794811 RepID=A0A1G2CFP6_9BACT|nr:MAG: UDP-N-acetylglucosamine 1-carboxyvinyltransferase [Candidatus Liptonbacteria bacterium RIFCSPLOWO2_01_FULL_52_25]OHA01529.1 MAG: UDP-N-acetylglucosamine 1-carboxyvinyltransferase [Candidatus Sungbacteria bacterium RIFCSPHIGHO2_02_FULL_49_12]